VLGADDHAVRAGQRLQHAEFLAGEGQDAARPAGPPPGPVDDEVTPHEDRRRSRAAPGQGPYPGDQLGEGERLDQVVVRAKIQAIHPVLDRGRRREHQDPGGLRPGGEARADRVTVDPRQVPVEDHHVIVREQGRLQGGRPVAGDVHRHAGIAQALRDAAGQRLMILHDQDAHASMVPQQW